MDRIALVTSSILYSIDIILSMFLYNLLSYIYIPITNVMLRSILTSILLIAAIFNAIILIMITLSLKYAEYYGFTKSALVIVSYLYLSLAYLPPLYASVFTFAIIALCMVEIVDLYFYRKIRKESLA